MAEFVIVDGQPTTDDHRDNGGNFDDIVAKLQAEQNRLQTELSRVQAGQAKQQAELTKSVDENAKLKAKVTHLEAELSTKTTTECKLHVYFVFLFW